MSDVEFEIPEDAGETAIELPATLPILALKDTVVFPQSMMPLAIGQERSIRLIDDVVAGDRFLALVTARDASIEASFAATSARRRSPATTSSISRIERSCPIPSGVSDSGKTTLSFNGRTGSTGGIWTCSSWSSLSASAISPCGR